VLPGISRVGCILSYSSLRGADKNHAINWAFAISVPALALISIFDLISIASTGISGVTFLNILACILAGVCSFIAAWGGVLLMRFVAFRSSFSIFGYMNWGVALISFILYLIV
jgi:undecaprenyl-diphosphatase